MRMTMVSSSSGLMPVMSVHGRGTGELDASLQLTHITDGLVSWLADLVWFSSQHNGMKIHVSERMLLNNLDYTKNSEHTKL